MLSTLGRTLRTPRRRLQARWLAMRGRAEDAAVVYSRTVPGWFHREEVRLLYRTVRALPHPARIAEIGSWQGRSTIVMARALRDAELERGRIFAIDPHQGSVRHPGDTLSAFRRNVARAGVAGCVEEMVCPSAQAARVLAERRVPLDMVFIDGDHSEEAVRADIRGFVPLLRPQGIVAFHDWLESSWPGVCKAYRDELAPKVTEVARAHSLLVTRLL
jgi:predicted O-methyltransferase YrrM